MYIHPYIAELVGESDFDPDSFFFNDTATTEIYTLSLHDALPICGSAMQVSAKSLAPAAGQRVTAARIGPLRSEEHTSELQSHLNLVCRLLLEKKKTAARPWCWPMRTGLQRLRVVAQRASRPKAST